MSRCATVLMVGMQLLATGAVAGVPVDSIETWDAGTTAGWTNGSSGVAVSNPGNALQFSHLKQSFPAYAEETVFGPVPLGLRLTNVTFRFRSAHVAPSALRLVVHSWSGGCDWYSPLDPPPAGDEALYCVPLDFTQAKWSSGPGSQAEEFEQDLRLVDRIGVYVRRHADTAKQDYGLDDFRIQGLYTEDVDGDGIANTWEVEYGFDPDEVTDGRGNADGDGMDNYAEYRAGTDPRDAESVLRLMIDAEGTNGVVLKWASVSNRTYRVWQADGSVAGFAPLVGGIPATDGTNTFIPGGDGAGIRFYRIEVE